MHSPTQTIRRKQQAVPASVGQGDALVEAEANLLKDVG
jgi:hypothetical protein